MATNARTTKRVHPIKSFLVGEEPMTNGLWGMVFFIFSEIMFFAGLIAAYLSLREDALVWAPTNGGEEVAANFRAVLFTILLLASTIPMQYAAFAIRKGNRRGMQWGMFFTLTIGAAFMVAQGFEWGEADFGVGDGGYGATFYLLTGFHGAHVIAGLLFIFAMFLRSHLGHFTATRNTAVEAATMYWHFVSIVWIALFTLLFLA